MNTLILNPGSRWLKISLFSNEGERVVQEKLAIDAVDDQNAFLDSLADVGQVGVRVVHGGMLPSPSAYTPNVRKVIESNASLAPLHNPVALALIDRVRERLPRVEIYCFFDTYFHRTLPKVAYTYPINHSLASKYQIRRYGFHGLALESVCTQLSHSCEHMQKPFPKKLILAHLGGGTSITGVQNGASVVTSMGLTPLEGAMMITRSGSIDPDMYRVLVERVGLSMQETSDLLNLQSGFQGLTGTTDTKKIIDEAMVGSQPFKDAFDVYVRSIVMHIYSTFGVLQGADAIVFSGGIGFRNEHIRPEILKWTEPLGLHKENTFAFEADEALVMFQHLAKG